MERTEDYGIGKILRECRQHMGISQNGFADLVCAERTTISKWENGKNLPPLDKLPDICSILNIEPNELFEKLIDLEQIRRNKMEKQNTGNNTSIQHFSNFTEALGGYRAFLLEQTELQNKMEVAMETGREEDMKEYKQDWGNNNDFLFLYNTKSGEIEGVRSYENGVLPENYLFATEYIPISFSWILTTVGTKKQISFGLSRRRKKTK